jgi:hypothetical protein
MSKKQPLDHEPIDVKIPGRFVGFAANEHDTPALIRGIAENNDYLACCAAIFYAGSVKNSRLSSLQRSLADEISRRNLSFDGIKNKLLPVASVLGLCDARCGVMPKDYYRILAIDPASGFEDIKKAYREKARLAHPDITGGDGKQFLDIQEAYTILSDPSLRRRYDASRNAIQSWAWSESSTKRGRTADKKPAAHGRYGYFFAAAIGVMIGIAFMADALFQEMSLVDGPVSRLSETQPPETVMEEHVAPDASNPADHDIPATPPETVLQPEPAVAVSQPPVSHEDMQLALSTGAINAKSGADEKPDDRADSDIQKDTPEAKPQKVAPVQPLPATPKKPESIAPPADAAIDDAKHAETPRLLPAPPPTASSPPESRKADIMEGKTKNKSAADDSIHMAKVAVDAEEVSAIRPVKPETQGDTMPPAPPETAAPTHMDSSDSLPAPSASMAMMEIQPEEPIESVPPPTAAEDPSHPPDAVALAAFLERYCRAYESKDIETFMTFFTANALENQKPINSLIPVYRNNFQMLDRINYHIDLLGFTMDPDSGRIRIHGAFSLAWLKKNEETWNRYHGDIRMDLAGDSSESFQIEQLVYAFENR